MNEAQRKAAEAAKAKEETDKRLAEVEKQYQEILEKVKREQASTKAQPVEDPEIESLFADLPDVAKIARIEAERARKAVEPEIQELRICFRRSARPAPSLKRLKVVARCIRKS